MKSAEAIVHCLKEENINVVFGYPGGTILPLYEALRKSEINHILVRHEQAAGHSASGYARATGDIGVCITTSGPGATNVITAIATAYMDSIPMIIITGQVNCNLIGKDAFQEADIVGATEPFTKYNYLVKNAKDIPRIMKEAFYIARTGRPGPVLIDIPVDIQNQEIDYKLPEEVKIRGYKPTIHGHKGQIKKALEKIKGSKRPLICIGGGIASAKAEAELKAFVEKSKIPAVHTLMGKDCLDTEHPYHIGLIGSHGLTYANKAVARADVLILLGTRIADRATGGAKYFARDAVIIHIDIDPAEIGKNLEAEIPVVGDVKNILQVLLSGVESLDTEEWLREISEWKEKNSIKPTSTNHLNPKLALKTISSIVDDSAILVSDVGQNQIWAAHHYIIKGKRKFFTSGGLGTMGYALPAAVGSKIGAPEKRVIAVVGDGSFQMSMFELGTIVQNRVNIIIVLFNNSGLGMVREIQEASYPGTYAVELDTNPDFIKIAEAYGIKGRKVTSNEEFEDAFREAMKSEMAFLIESIVDPKESTL